MKTLVLSSSDMIYASSLKCLAIGRFCTPYRWEVGLFLGRVISLDLESWRLNFSSNSLGKPFFTDIYLKAVN